MAEINRLNSIGAKDLGNLALPDFCPRCFWYERHFGSFPSRFPGIFSVIDSVSKKSVRRSLSERKKLPDWLSISDVITVVPLSEAGKAEQYQNREYLVAFHKESGWLLKGAPDNIFKLKDDTFHIVDYKTARHTKTQDGLYPLYEVQLNCYALLAHKMPVSKLSLVYCEPNSELENDTDFDLKFTSEIVDVKVNTKIITPLLKKAREIVDLETPPANRTGCRQTCYFVDKIKA
jgi:hypothetical protein